MEKAQINIIPFRLPSSLSMHTFALGAKNHQHPWQPVIFVDERVYSPQRESTFLTQQNEWKNVLRDLRSSFANMPNKILNCWRMRERRERVEERGGGQRRDGGKLSLFVHFPSLLITVHYMQDQLSLNFE